MSPDEQRERDRAVSALRARAAIFRTHTVYLSFLNNSPVVNLIPASDPKLRGDLACQLCHAIADEIERAASIVQYALPNDPLPPV